MEADGIYTDRATTGHIDHVMRLLKALRWEQAISVQQLSWLALNHIDLLR